VSWIIHRSCGFSRDRRRPVWGSYSTDLQVHQALTTKFGFLLIEFLGDRTGTLSSGIATKARCPAQHSYDQASSRTHPPKAVSNTRYEMTEQSKIGDDFQKAGKEGFDTAARSYGEVNKGFQAVVAEVTSYSKKAVEDGH